MPFHLYTHRAEAMEFESLDDLLAEVRERLAPEEPGVNITIEVVADTEDA